MLACAPLSVLALLPAALVPRVHHQAHAQRHPSRCLLSAKLKDVPLEEVQPAPTLEPREVISSVLAALHRSNWDTPTPFHGFEVALRFLAPTHQAKRAGAKPAGFARYMRQPHKVYEMMWNEYRFEGEVIYVESDEGVQEAYQMCSLRGGPDEDWTSSRWKLVKANLDYGTYTQTQWMVDAVFAYEPDTPTDVEFQASAADAGEEYQGLDWNGMLVPLESPTEVVGKVMRALRSMNTPYPLHGAVIATRYCSPQNRASELSPQIFARYLEDPWYSILEEWDEIQGLEEEDGDEDEDEDDGNVGETVEVLVRRKDEDSFTLVSWDLALYNGQWLIDSLNIV